MFDFLSINTDLVQLERFFLQTDINLTDFLLFLKKYFGTADSKNKFSGELVTFLEEFTNLLDLDSQKIKSLTFLDSYTSATSRDYLNIPNRLKIDLAALKKVILSSSKIKKENLVYEQERNKDVIEFLFCLLQNKKAFHEKFYKTELVLDKILEIFIVCLFGIRQFYLIQQDESIPDTPDRLDDIKEESVSSFNFIIRSLQVLDKFQIHTKFSSILSITNLVRNCIINCLLFTNRRKTEKIILHLCEFLDAKNFLERAYIYHLNSLIHQSVLPVITFLPTPLSKAIEDALDKLKLRKEKRALLYPNKCLFTSIPDRVFEAMNLFYANDLFLFNMFKENLSTDESFKSFLIDCIIPKFKKMSIIDLFPKENFFELKKPMPPTCTKALKSNQKIFPISLFSNITGNVYIIFLLLFQFEDDTILKGENCKITDKHFDYIFKSLSTQNDEVRNKLFLEIRDNVKDCCWWSGLRNSMQRNFAFDLYKKYEEAPEESIKTYILEGRGGYTVETGVQIKTYIFHVLLDSLIYKLTHNNIPWKSLEDCRIGFNQAAYFKILAQALAFKMNYIDKLYYFKIKFNLRQKISWGEFSAETLIKNLKNSMKLSEEESFELDTSFKIEFLKRFKLEDKFLTLSRDSYSQLLECPNTKQEFEAFSKKFKTYYLSSAEFTKHISTTFLLSNSVFINKIRLHYRRIFNVVDSLYPIFAAKFSEKSIADCVKDSYLRYFVPYSTIENFEQPLCALFDILCLKLLRIFGMSHFEVIEIFPNLCTLSTYCFETITSKYQLFSLTHPDFFTSQVEQKIDFFQESNLDLSAKERLILKGITKCKEVYERADPEHETRFQDRQAYTIINEQYKLTPETFIKDVRSICASSLKFFIETDNSLKDI